ncbi:hypothetical protein GCM10010347_28350 [Streptomyces cirratus]|uniref:Uncharacterized protein n=1 Tax=Streptomyces cirratus TaxID=68187 RepID=A0ABQ3ES49_9ACTN|nr:hypothetical protein GCM10010347_28350 [Streptomyces cirratus]
MQLCGPGSASFRSPVVGVGVGVGVGEHHAVLTGHGPAEEPAHGLEQWPAERFCSSAGTGVSSRLSASATGSAGATAGTAFALTVNWFRAALAAPRGPASPRRSSR